MLDWQFISVVIAVAGAALFLAVRAVRFLRMRRGNTSSCGGACHGCSQPPTAQTVSLQLPPSMPSRE